jgi:hypothetical protein
LRNLFDQYRQTENRITHALLSALHEDRRLLRLFLHELVKAKPPVDARKLVVLEQQYPGEEEPIGEELSEEDEEKELDRRGIPDGWIFAEQQAWCVVIESKVLVPPSGHRSKATGARQRDGALPRLSRSPSRRTVRPLCKTR